ncbi:MAG: hypothetical protein JO142_04135 [Burkholderiales bacterium]|nr:hypothetical protein [Burkholderiales bacterium]
MTFDTLRVDLHMVGDGVGEPEFPRPKKQQELQDDDGSNFAAQAPVGAGGEFAL